MRGQQVDRKTAEREKPQQQNSQRDEDNQKTMSRRRTDGGRRHAPRIP
jgi:hypothetical protein